MRGLWTLYTADPLENGQTSVSAKSVEALYSEAGRVFVAGAITQGQQLIVSGTQRLVPQQKVIVQQAATQLVKR